MTNMYTLSLVALIMWISMIPVSAENERFYQLICADLLKGKTEVVMSDRTRIDILTDDEAIEVDWASKWAEGIGQALHYSTATGRHAGLILILKGPKDVRYVERVKNIIRIKSLRIILYTIDGTTRELRKVSP